MRVSVKGRYGLEAMLCLAMHSSSGHVSLNRIAEISGISENYLEQLFIVLRKKGIVKSIRGAQGGYQLMRGPSEISVGEILRALEGPLVPVSCVLDGEGEKCSKYDLCATKNVWSAIGDEVGAAVDGVSLKDLIESCHNDCSNSSLEYFI